MDILLSAILQFWIVKQSEKILLLWISISRNQFINEVKCVFSEILVAKWKDYQNYYTLSSDVFSITGWGLILILVCIQIVNTNMYAKRKYTAEI